jgi:spore coat protein U-like protein
MKKISLSIILLQVVQLGHADDKPTTSATLMVSATIENGCSLSNTEQTLDFGQQPAMSQSNLNTQVINSAQTWNLRCTQNLPVSVRLSGGDSFLNNQRRMKLVGQNEFVPYRLYQKSDLSAEYISGNSYSLTPATASNNLINFAVYGVANLNNNNQPRAAGLYKDTVAITISW